MEFKRLRTSLGCTKKCTLQHSNVELPWGEHEDQSRHAKASKEKITAQEDNRKEDMECGSEEEDEDFWWYKQKITDEEDNNTKPDMERGSEDVDEDFRWYKQKITDEKDNNTKPDMERGSEDVDDDSSCSTDLDGLVFEDTDDEHDVGQMEKSSDTKSHPYVRRKSNWWSEDECSTDLDYPYSEEALADDQDATACFKGVDIQSSKLMEENKKGVPSEDKLLVDFAAPSSLNLVESPTDPLCERSAAHVHQAGPQKKIGVQNTLSNEVNVRTDENFSSTTSQEENESRMGQATRRLAILRLDLSPLRAADLFARLSCFLPEGGEIVSVSMYTSVKHGPVGLLDDEIDKVHASMESRQRYYGVVECDSTDTAKFLYNDFTKTFSYIGVTRKMLELVFVPDSMEFDDHLCDAATEEPSTCRGPDLVHLLSDEDLKEIGVVVTDSERPESPERCSMNQMWDDSGLDESLDTSDGDEDDEDELETPSKTIHPRFGDSFARKKTFTDNRKADMECGSEDEDIWWGVDFDNLVLKDTDDEQDVGKMEESYGTMLDAYVRRKRNWWSEDECSTDLDYPYSEEALADDQDATACFKGDDIQCSKLIEENKKGVPSEDKLLVDFARKAAFTGVKLSYGTTIVGVQLKNGLGTYLAADGLSTLIVPGEEQDSRERVNKVKIHRLGEPVYLLAACAGHTLWIYPIMSHVEDMVESNKWTAENCAVYTHMFLNSNYEPNRTVWGLPRQSNLKKTSCTILFVSCTKNKTELWSADCRKPTKHGAYNSDWLACFGSGAKHAERSLKPYENTIASGVMSNDEVLLRLLEAFESASQKDDNTGGNILGEKFGETDGFHVFLRMDWCLGGTYSCGAQANILQNLIDTPSTLYGFKSAGKVKETFCFSALSS